MQVRIDSVVIKRRVRRDLGDLSSLMDSLRSHGQLNPILINRNSELIAGHRRLESARRLGWTSINAVVLDQVTAERGLELELEENVQRKQLTQEELAEALTRLDRLKHPGLLRRILRFFARLFRRLFSRE